MMDRSHSIVVGIDFGTTYSGVAFARDAEPDRIHFVSNWRSSNLNSFPKQKVPTSIYYGHSFEPPTWGYDVDSEEDALRWFKLLLLDDEHMPAHLKRSKYIRTAKELLKKENKHVIEVIADYLRLVWEHSLRAIEKTMGEAMVKLSTFKFVVTLPAIWPAYAQIRMHKAIAAAGLLDKRAAGETVLTFLPEPEAAALATLHKMHQRPDMKKNDDFVVCDCGGGTVDIITYKIHKPLMSSIRESVPGNGRLCGAVRLDEAFARLLRTKMPMNVLKALSPAERQRLMYDNWETGIKPGFANDERSWTVRIPFCASLSNVQYPKDIILGREDIWLVFEDVLTEVASLVLDQIQEAHRKYGKPPKYVILVGGFGRSCALYDHLQKKIGLYFASVNILQDEGTDPWTAICEGAVIHGLKREQSLSSAQCNLVDSRFARASIGTMYNALPFEEDVHDIKDKEWCPMQQEYQASDQIHWFIYKGEVVNGNEPTVFEFFQALTEQPTELVNEMVYSQAGTPPNRFDHTVKFLCRMQWSFIPDIAVLPEKRNNAGHIFYELPYRIEMVTQGVSQDFQVFYEDKVVAAHSVSESLSESLKTAMIEDD
ncbi:Hsp70 family protein [Metarhizium robertsii]|uniref:Hsp70 family protein n=1 Tax=Metarhizium robertsii TaxID=568076 RepID=A0A0A1V2B1_9HYPO|nr:Hsp70 family protein [Metarhizium robertsii]